MRCNTPCSWAVLSKGSLRCHSLGTGLHQTLDVGPDTSPRSIRLPLCRGQAPSLHREGGHPPGRAPKESGCALPASHSPAAVSSERRAKADFLQEKRKKASEGISHRMPTAAWHLSRVQTCPKRAGAEGVRLGPTVQVISDEVGVFPLLLLLHGQVHEALAEGSQGVGELDWGHKLQEVRPQHLQGGARHCWSGAPTGSPGSGGRGTGNTGAKPLVLGGKT